MFLGLCFALVFSACDRSDFEPSAHQTSADLELLANGSASALRAMETTSPDWKEGSYDATMANQYQISTPEKLSGNRYRFKVRSNHLSRFEVWIKYYSPKGDVVYQKLDPNGNYINFTLDRTFQQEGVYYCRFFISKRDKNGAYLSIHQNSIAINVVLPLYIPPVTDDYEQYVNINAYEDPWNFYPQQCVSWVALKVNQMWRTEREFRNDMFGGALSHAKYWKNIFVRNGYSVDRNPKAGDIIWFPPNVRENAVTYSKELGHVGFVHEVNNEITYSNYDGGVVTSYRVSTTNEAFVRRNGIYFIHIQRKK